MKVRPLLQLAGHKVFSPIDRDNSEGNGSFFENNSELQALLEVTPEGDPLDPEVAYLKSHHLLDQGHIEDAIELINEVQRQKPLSLTTMQVVATVHSRAETMCRELFKKDPADRRVSQIMDLISQVGTIGFESRFFMIENLILRGDFTRAFEMLKLAATLVPHSEALIRLARMLAEQSEGRVDPPKISPYPFSYYEKKSEGPSPGEFYYLSEIHTEIMDKLNLDGSSEIEGIDAIDAILGDSRSLDPGLSELYCIKVIDLTKRQKFIEAMNLSKSILRDHSINRMVRAVHSYLLGAIGTKIAELIKTGDRPALYFDLYKVYSGERIPQMREVLNYGRALIQMGQDQEGIDVIINCLNFFGFDRDVADSCMTIALKMKRPALVEALNKRLQEEKAKAPWNPLIEVIRQRILEGDLKGP